MKTIRRFHFVWLTVTLAALLFAGQSAVGQSSPEVVAEGLRAPQGIEIDEQGRIWVAEQGSGNDDAGVSVVTSDGQVHAFLTGMPSNIVENMPEAAHHLLFSSGELWATQGLGETAPEGYLIRVDTAGFVPGDPPKSVDVQEDVGTFVLDYAFEDDTDQTNVYNMTLGPEGHLYIVDASANAVIRRASDTGELGVFAAFPRIENPTPVGPPMTQAVPTGIVFVEDRFYVSSFPGFPFPENVARIFAVDLDGNVSLFREGLTTAVDLTVDPHGALVVAQLGRFDPATGFAPGSGSIVRLSGEEIDTLASGLNFPTGIDFAPNGDLYFSSIADGQILRLDAGVIGTAAERSPSIPRAFTLLQNYPNPFNPGTTITFRLSRRAHVNLTVYDVLGRAVRQIVDAPMPSGTHDVRWDGTDQSGEPAASGAYLYRIEADGQVESRTMQLLR